LPLKRGGTARFRFDNNKIGFSYWFEAQPDRARDWNSDTLVFTDTIGPGTFALSMTWIDPCSGNHTGTATLTITDSSQGAKISSAAGGTGVAKPLWSAVARPPLWIPCWSPSVIELSSMRLAVLGRPLKHACEWFGTRNPSAAQ
jgi:hypothetical protein